MRENTGDREGITGDGQVDEALRPLARLDDLPIHEHATVVDDVHRALRRRLGTGEDITGAGAEG